ncbi:MAG: energy-coupling factor transporter ATPase [Lachnospiraceae bacterium]|nr:energy-coupling factor transporter ATPase [Lachnospiraceae bacterium]
MIEFRNVDYIYEPETPYEMHAVKNVSFTIEAGEFVALLGHTGSGKSTLIEHFNGLLKPSSGSVLFHGTDIFSKEVSMKEIRSKIGIVFQYPEHQLFESTVLRDVCFGPKNMGLSEAEQKERAKAALTSVGLDESYYEMSPFELSGGEKRRAAIAGVLAMEPEALILDEPSAGLDPRGRDEILGLIRKLWQERGLTVVLVSHSMDEAARYAQRVIVMHEGVKKFDGPTREVFTHAQELTEIGLGVPSTVRIFSMLRARGEAFPEGIDELSVEGAAQALLTHVLHKEGGHV